MIASHYISCRSSTRFTAMALQSPPRGAGTPQRFSPSAIWRSDAPPAFMGRMTGSRSAARLSARAAITALSLARPPSWLERLAGVPSLTQRALATLVSWEFIAGLHVELGEGGD